MLKDRVSSTLLLPRPSHMLGGNLSRDRMGDGKTLEPDNLCSKPGSD